MTARLSAIGDTQPESIATATKHNSARITEKWWGVFMFRILISTNRIEWGRLKHLTG
jgi:hypothetical protein